MPIKPYNPSPIEGFKVSLTKRQELAHVRKALEMSKDAAMAKIISESQD